MSKKGTIFDIQRFSVHDGPGIRTTVFFKGCPLNCLWCQNPESINPKVELVYNKDRCLGCDKCIEVCPNGALKNSSCYGKIYDDNSCLRCWDCASICPTGALEVQGKEHSVDEVIDEVILDKAFYNRSGGGVTLSGGEPTLQFDFCLKLLKSLKTKGIHTALDTSGYIDKDKFAQIIPHLDLLLYDIKHSNLRKHYKLTGVTNELILNNLTFADEQGVPIYIRIPVIPGYNDSRNNFTNMREIIGNLKNVEDVLLLAYHELGESKRWKFDKTRKASDEIEKPNQGKMKKLERLMKDKIKGVKIHYR